MDCVILTRKQITGLAAKRNLYITLLMFLTVQEIKDDNFLLCKMKVDAEISHPPYSETRRLAQARPTESDSPRLAC